MTESAHIDRRAKGLAAAARIARKLGLPVDDPRVLSDRGNLLVRFAPVAVVARVSTLTAWTRREPEAWLAREVEVASLAAVRGGPVIRPSDLVAPGPHRYDGFVMTFWEYVEATPVRLTARRQERGSRHCTPPPRVVPSNWHG